VLEYFHRQAISLKEYTLNQAQQSIVNQPPERRIFLEGLTGAGKTTAAVARLMRLLGSGVPAGRSCCWSRSVPWRALMRPRCASGAAAGGVVVR